MRHRRHFRRLNRTTSHRLALRRNMAQSLFEHGQITTTLPKAKNLRPFAEKLVTLAVRARKARDGKNPSVELAVRRSIHHLLSDRVVIPAEHRTTYASMSDAAREKSVRMQSGRRYRTGEPRGRLAFTSESVTHRLIETIAPRYVDRPGGYTRIIRLAKARIGDATPLAMIQLVGAEQAPGSLTKPEKSARRRRADSRYALAVKLTRKRPDAGTPKGATAGGEAETPA